MLVLVYFDSLQKVCKFHLHFALVKQHICFNLPFGDILQKFVLTQTYYTDSCWVRSMFICKYMPIH